LTCLELAVVTESKSATCNT